MNRAPSLAIVISILGLTPALSAPASICPDATTTRDIERCLSTELQKSEKLLEQYLAGARVQVGPSGEVRESLDSAQAAWLAYQQAHCAAVYKIYAPGSGASTQLLGCKITLNQKRAHELWDAYLKNTASPLPEPKE